MVHVRSPWHVLVNRVEVLSLVSWAFGATMPIPWRWALECSNVSVFVPNR